MSYEALASRYASPAFYRRSGRSGLKLPLISLGLWHNFGEDSDFDKARKMLLGAFDLGITHFDLANNYGPPPGSAETTFGRILHKEFARYRDEILVSTKAGYDMWAGPYGEWGSRKHLLASLDQSLLRLGLEYVDIFYSHRPDPETPLEETCGALVDAVHAGKALYVGISNYGPEETERAARLLKEAGTPCMIHQPRYNLFERTPEHGLFDVLEQTGIGCIAFSPLAQGVLSDRYLNGIPSDARAARDPRFLKPEQITPETLRKVAELNRVAERRGQSLAQMALSWVLRRPCVTSALIGASSLKQIRENVGATKNLAFDADDLTRLDEILAS